MSWVMSIGRAVNIDGEESTSMFDIIENLLSCGMPTLIIAVLEELSRCFFVETIF